MFKLHNELLRDHDFLSFNLDCIAKVNEYLLHLSIQGPLLTPTSFSMRWMGNACLQNLFGVPIQRSRFILSNLNKICVSSHPISCSTIFTSFTSCYIIFFSFMSSRAQSVDCFPLPSFVSFVSEFWQYIIETCQTWREVFFAHLCGFFGVNQHPRKTMFCIK